MLALMYIFLKVWDFGGSLGNSTSWRLEDVGENWVNFHESFRFFHKFGLIFT